MVDISVHTYARYASTDEVLTGKCGACGTHFLCVLCQQVILCSYRLNLYLLTSYRSLVALFRVTCFYVKTDLELLFVLGAFLLN